jgi:hypothetical protein
VPVQQDAHGMNNIVVGFEADQFGRHVFFDGGSHEPALRMMHSVQLPQLPQSGRLRISTPIASPATASTNRGTAIRIVVITRLSVSN